jgi:hypothetical protein
VQEITVNVNKNDAATAQLALGGIDPGESVFFGNVRVRLTTDPTTTNLVATPSNLFGPGWSRAPDVLGSTVSLAAKPEGSTTLESSAQTLHRIVGSTTGAYGYWTTAFKTSNNSTATLQTRISFVAYTPVVGSSVSMSVEVNSTVAPNPSFASRQITVTNTTTRYFLDVNKNSSATAYLVFAGFTLGKQVYIGDLREEALIQGEFTHSSGFGLSTPKIYNSAYWGSVASQVATNFNLAGDPDSYSDAIGDFVYQRSRADGIKVINSGGTNFLQLAIKDGFKWKCPSNCYDRAQIVPVTGIPGNFMKEGEEFEFIYKIQHVDAATYPLSDTNGVLIGAQIHDNVKVPPWAQNYLDLGTPIGRKYALLHSKPCGPRVEPDTVIADQTQLATGPITYRMHFKPSATNGLMSLEQWNGTGWTTKYSINGVPTANVQQSLFLDPNNPNTTCNAPLLGANTLLGDLIFSFYDYNNQFTNPNNLNAATQKEFRLRIYYISLVKK